MKIPGIISLLASVLCLCLAGTAVSDPVSEAEDVPATAAEMQFIDRVIDRVKASVPPMDGWSQDVSVTASGNTVREGRQVMIFENARNFPLMLNVQINFQRITAAQEQRAVEERSAQELQQEMMAAAQSGDMEKMQRLQGQLAAMMQAQMTAGPMGQAAGVTPMAPAEKPVKFYVQVIVNGEGEHIGKQYDMAAPGVTRAFRIDKGKDDFLTYKYYLGAWDVSELDKRNWRVVFPKSIQTPGNHLRAMVVKAEVYGDRESVEKYVKSSLDINGLKGVLN